MADELLTVAQAATYLKLSEKTIRRLINERLLLASKVDGRSWRIREKDIENYLNSNTNKQERSNNHG